LQRADRSLEPPFFRPEFTAVVAAIREGVEVAVLEEDGTPVGFFPYERRGRTAKPVGGRLSDFQGIVARPEAVREPEALLRACGLRAWSFDHLLASQEPFRRYHAVTAPSPVLDLSQGYAAWERAHRGGGSETMAQLHRKARKLAREVGPLRFEFHTNERRVLETLLAWKREQYRRTTTTDITAMPWVVALLERILATDADGFGGVLSALWTGDRLAAVHLGMRSDAVLHSWLPSYDRSLHRCSPGLVLLLRIAEAAAARGIRTIHLGKGPEEYKQQLMSGVVLVAEGCVETRPLVAALRRGTFGVRRWLLSSPLRRPARGVARAAAWVAPTLREHLKMR
jgi:CelD/BcsL family acetyltransferase involved in cellulose biosynthesis